MVVQDFASKTVFLDTAPLIYFMEGQSPYQDVLYQIFNLNDEGVFSFVTSTITLLEVLVKPLREGKMALAQQYEDILMGSPGMELVDLTPDIAARAAQLRAQYFLKTPDAIQLATAIGAGADYFLTNDIRLKAVASINVITIGELQ